MDGFNGGGTGESGGSSPVQPQGGTSSPAAQRGGGFDTPSISLPKGGGAIRGIGEKFGANPVTGTGSMSVPIFTSLGRSGFGPQLSLSYDSGAGNGPFGIGWNLSLPAITRKTDKGLPRYRDMADSDEFILSGAEDLVPVLKQDAQGQWLPEDVPPRTVDGNVYTIRRYRPRIEGLFARIERWTNQSDHADCCWRSISRDNITTWYGKTKQSRITDPNEPTRIFSWLICESYDDKGNVIAYHYSEEDSTKVDTSQVHERNRNHKSRSVNRYLERITYGNRTPYYPVLVDDKPWPALPGDAEWLFEVVFDYDQGHYEALDPDPGLPPEKQHQRVRAAHRPVLDSWATRPDPFSSYRAGFEVRTYRRCRRVLMFHRFTELGIEPCLVRSTEFDYHDLDYRNEPSLEIELGHAGSTRFASKISTVTQSGYVHHTHEPIKAEDVEERAGVRYVTYIKKSLPPLEFQYTQAAIQEQLQTIDAESLENLPQGLDGAQYQWADLDGEGTGGILTEQNGAWFYKRNLSPLPIKDEHGALVKTARFAPMEKITPLPSFASLSSGQQQLLDLAGDGQVDVVAYADPIPGFFERTSEGDWQPFKAFKSLPNIEWQDPNLKFVDLTGDGHADIFVTEDEAFTWYASLAEAGFAPAQKVHQLLDEERGPRLVFNDGTQSIYLSDFSGDGLSDLVRIRNGEVCYWPNLGYCRFGAKVTIDNAPWFDTHDQFDQKRIRLADIDGTGVTDILYLKHDGVRIYFNHSGNSWTKAYHLTHLPAIDNMTNVMTVDLLGNGTACLVWSSPLPGNIQAPMRYVDLMGGQKPHLLTKVVNNLGAETHVYYAPSTQFYLKDKQQGKEWITRLHFPVHVVERVETYDHISHNRFVTTYAYHHGYFDGHEREFRGFGMVEQWDTEEYATLSAAGEFPQGDNIDMASHVPPVHTKTWFHTGAYLGRNRVSRYFAGLLNANDKGEYYREPGLDNIEAEKLLLQDTILPDGLTIDEEREACRALKGQMLRQEVYAEDKSDKQSHPYTVTEQNFTISRLQPKKDNDHAVFFTHPRESLNYHYERNSDDPRISHTFTLDVDNYGNVRKSAAAGYGRRPGLSPLQGGDKDKQEQMLITYTENEFTNEIDEDDNYRTPLPSESRSYELTGLDPELDASRFSFDQLYEDNFKRIADLTDIPYQQDVDYTAKQKRVIECVRTLYRSNDMKVLLKKHELQSQALPGETYKLAFTPGLLDQVYQRNGQPLIDDYNKVLKVDQAAGDYADRGGYVDLDEDNHWWIPSGRVFFSPGTNDDAATELDYARDQFFLPHRYHDPFYSEVKPIETLISYDSYNLLVQESRDVLGNRVTVGKRKQVDNSLEEQGNDYRVLQPRLMMDPNRNCSEVTFDALGLVAGTAVMGKPEDNPAKGDLLETTFVSDLTRQQIDDYENDPLGQHAFDLLGNATSRIVYDMDRYYLSQESFPNDPTKWEAGFTSSIVRETHVSDLPGNREFKLQVSFSYSDGFGREIQKKIQAEPGPVTEGGPIVNPRWVGSGWTIFNNKGKPVRQYEPFFSRLAGKRHRFEFGEIVGVSPILFYDPVGRVVTTLHPNNSFKKVLFSPWQQESWDVNDTVKLDPRTDADVHAYTREYFKAQPASWKTWLQQRVADPSNPPADSHGQNPEQDAAVRTLEHADSPTMAHFDALGRPFLSVANNGKDNIGNDILYETRTILDIEGNQREVIDARGCAVMRYDYYMAGPEGNDSGDTPNRIHQSSMEAGERWILNDVAGSPIRSWDSRGHNYRTEYDKLRRPLNRYVRGTDATHSDSRTVGAYDILIENIEYGEGQADDLNLRTQVFKQYDGSGVVTNMGQNPNTGKNEAYDFKGNLLRGRRQVCVDHEGISDWKQDPALEQGVFAGSTCFDALNRPIQQIAPHDPTANPLKLDITQFTYNDANMLETVSVWLAKDSEPAELLDPVTADHSVVKNINYDAKGQRELIEYGNGAETRYDYDENTFRLIKLYTRRGVGYDQDCGIEPDRFLPPEVPPPHIPCGIQNLHYSYDPVGNITHIHDLAQPRVYFDNDCIEASNDYRYDAIYRLMDASGREHKGGNVPPGPDNHSREYHPITYSCNDMQHYVEHYRYDEVGNIMEMVHHSGGTLTTLGPVIWRRRYQYTTYNNQLRSTSHPGETAKPDYSDDPAEYYQDVYEHDRHGSIVTMPHLSGMQWDFKDQLRTTTRQVVNDKPPPNGKVPETTYYVYDSSGQRMRKVTVRQNGYRKDERLYLGSYEIYRKFNGNGQGIKLQRESLHVMDDKQRVAIVETKNIDATGVVDPHSNDEVGVAVMRYQINNHLGSACTELDDKANVVSYEEYHPYGNTAYQAKNKNIKAAAKRYRYSGKERDEESGLYYYGARYYAAWIGNWLSPDKLDTVNGISLYSFVDSNPIKLVDPTGLRPKLTTWLLTGGERWEASEEQISEATQDMRRTDDNFNTAAGYGGLVGVVSVFENMALLGYDVGRVAFYDDQKDNMFVDAVRAVDEQGLSVIPKNIIQRSKQAFEGDAVALGELAFSAAIIAESAVNVKVTPITITMPVLNQGGALALEAATVPAVAGVAGLLGSGGVAAMATQGSGGGSNEAKYRVGKHGNMPSPRPGQQSHHGLMSSWMKKHFPKYNPDKAPAILMPEKMHHATFGVYNKWRALMTKKMGGKFDWAKVSEPQMKALSEKMFDAAKVPRSVRAQYWKEYTKYKASIR